MADIIVLWSAGDIEQAIHENFAAEVKQTVGKIKLLDTAPEFVSVVICQNFLKPASKENIIHIHLDKECHPDAYQEAANAVFEAVERYYADISFDLIEVRAYNRKDGIRVFDKSSVS